MSKYWSNITKDIDPMYVESNLRIKNYKVKY